MAQKKTTIGKGTLHFYFTGESFTYLIRDFWNSNLVSSVIEITNDCEIPVETAIKICTGELKCVGDTRDGDHTLSIQDDKDADEIYFTLQTQVKHLEKRFVEISQSLTRTTRKYRLLAGQENENGTLDVAGEPSIHGAHYRKTYSKNDKKVIKNLRKDQKKILEGLTILYPLVNKTMGDLPVEEIGTAFSDIEIDHYRKYDSSDGEWERGTSKQKKERKVKKEKKPFDPTSYDMQDDETDKEYFIRRGKMAKATNLVVDIKKSNTENAWISPKGKVYTVQYQPFPMHVNAASEYVYMGIVPETINNESEWLDNNGWMKLTGGKFFIDKKLTQAQIDVLMDYMIGKDLKEINWFGEHKKLVDVIEENESLSNFRVFDGE